MEQTGVMQFRLMTYNVGGARKDFGSKLAAILDVVKEVSPDILVAQEVMDYQDVDGEWFSVADQIARAGEFGSNYALCPTLAMKEHMHVQKAVFVNALFNDWQDCSLGNAVFCRGGFTRLSDTSKSGNPRNVPLYRPPVFEGNRDTDPRYTVLARVNRPPLFPFIVGVHLATLLGERGSKDIPGKAEQAQIARLTQVRRLLDLIRQHLLDCGELVFLLGDFNAVSSEISIASGLEKEAGFVRLAPANDTLATHPKVTDAIDHIFMYPAERLVEYQCWTVDTAIARNASDHLPVVADVTVR